MTENKCMTVNQEENVVAEKNRKKVKIHVREMTFIAMMGAIGSILVFFRFPLPLLPPFLSFDVSPIIEMIGGFMYGPVAAFLIIILKILLQLVLQGSHSVGTGELQNLILGCAYVMPAILFYRKKTRKRAAIGMIIGTLTVSIVSVFSKFILNHTILCKIVWYDNAGHCCNVYRSESESNRWIYYGIIWNCTI